jgi:hypothetical protein
MPPGEMTQEAIEGNDQHLRRLLRARPGERPDSQDLWEYLQDLRYTKIRGGNCSALHPSANYDFTCA